jgi:hypothetical protein
LEICGFSQTNLLDIYSQVKETAKNVDDIVRELPNAKMVKSHLGTHLLKSFWGYNYDKGFSFGYLQKPKDLWINHIFKDSLPETSQGQLLLERYPKCIILINAYDGKTQFFFLI